MDIVSLTTLGAVDVNAGQTIQAIVGIESDYATEIDVMVTVSFGRLHDSDFYPEFEQVESATLIPGQNTVIMDVEVPQDAHGIYDAMVTVEWDENSVSAVFQEVINVIPQENRIVIDVISPKDGEVVHDPRITVECNIHPTAEFFAVQINDVTVDTAENVSHYVNQFTLPQRENVIRLHASKLGYPEADVYLHVTYEPIGVEADVVFPVEGETYRYLGSFIVEVDTTEDVDLVKVDGYFGAGNQWVTVGHYYPMSGTSKIYVQADCIGNTPNEASTKYRVEVYKMGRLITSKEIYVNFSESGKDPWPSDMPPYRLLFPYDGAVITDADFDVVFEQWWIRFKPKNGFRITVENSENKIVAVKTDWAYYEPDKVRITMMPPHVGDSTVRLEPVAEGGGVTAHFYYDGPGGSNYSQTPPPPPPQAEVHIVEPEDGSVLHDTVSIKIVGSSENAQVEVRVDGNPVGKATYVGPLTNPIDGYSGYLYEYDLDTTKFPNGEHTISVFFADILQGTAEDSITCTFVNESYSEVIVFEHPRDGEAIHYRDFITVIVNKCGCNRVEAYFRWNGSTPGPSEVSKWDLRCEGREDCKSKWFTKFSLPGPAGPYLLTIMAYGGVPGATETWRESKTITVIKQD